MTRQMKSSGIEWIGEIPADWNIRKIFQVFTQVKCKNQGMAETNLLSLSYGKIKQKNIETSFGLLPESFESYNIIDKNDIVLRLTDLQNDQKSLRVGLSTQRGIITSAYVTIRAKNPRMAPYLYYLLHTFDIKKGFYGMGDGVRQGLNWDELKHLSFVLPSLSEQQKIADYLDEKCSAIDEVIAKTEQSVEEYKKLKQSVITEAITKGIRPNRKMKSSGVEWIGDIPEKWNVRKLFQVFTQVKNKNQGMVETNLLSLSYGKIKQKNIETSFGLLPESFETYNIIDKNDIVLRLTDLQNDQKSLRVGLSTQRGIITSAYVTMRAKKPHMAPYLYYLLHTFDIEKGFYGMGDGVRQGLNWDELKHLSFVLPPLSEQKEIADYLDKKCAEIDSLIEKKQQFLTELAIYKKSMIYEYVTGKKEAA